MKKEKEKREKKNIRQPVKLTSLLTLYCTHEAKVEELRVSRDGRNCEDDAIWPKCVLGEKKAVERRGGKKEAGRESNRDTFWRQKSV